MAPSDATRLFHRQFETQAARTPDAVALHDGDRSVTYAELQDQARRVAASLRRRGIGAAATVGVHLERSIDWVAAVLGILGTGAAAMPVPPTYPAGRLREILTHAKLDAVVDAAASRLDPALGVTATDIQELLHFPGAAGPLDAGAIDQPAFVLCSSGSTGTPKMIVRSHRSFFHRLEWTWSRHPYVDGEACCQKAQPTTTHAIYELFEPLLHGVPVIIVPDEVARDLEAFWDTIRVRHITRLLIVPSALQSSLDMPAFTPPPLRAVVLMGEYVSPALAERAAAAFPESTSLYSIYGSTEASSTLVCDLHDSRRPGHELPLGRPISPDVQALVLASDLSPTPPGAVGRLYIAGPALFSGYFRSPEQTAAVVTSRPGRAERLYDTHDQVRLLDDGNLEFVGRVDDTVKIRGFRVDLQEVERELMRAPGVRSAAVAVASGGSAGNRLLAFVTPASVNRDAVFATLRDRLPAYMIPSALTGLDAFPLTPRGKLDRVRLLREHETRAAAPADERARTETERRITEIWAGVLGHTVFGADRSFFEVGGTSLTVFALVHRLRTAFALDREQLPEQLVYRLPTIAALAAYVDEGAPAEALASQVATPLLVTMRTGSDSSLPPLFLIASAGGTLGAYDKLVGALRTTREIIGVRDPYVWGDRQLTEGFDAWVGRYVAAIRARQPRGPYAVAAYSSAGAFGYEVAQRLRAAGEEVATLILIDPLAIDRSGRRRFGWWALRATWASRTFRTLVKLAGRLRLPLHRLRLFRAPSAPSRPLAPDEIRELERTARNDLRHLLNFAALLELNTGLPFALEPDDFAGCPPEQYLSVLHSRIAKLMPDVDAETTARIIAQYSVQVRTQHAYTLRPYDGRVLLAEPASPYQGLMSAHFRPYVPKLTARILRMGDPPARTSAITAQFAPLAAHYRSMRDDRFVQGLAAEIDRVLG